MSEYRKQNLPEQASVGNENEVAEERLLGLMETLLNGYSADVPSDPAYDAGAVRAILDYQFHPSSNNNEPFPSGYTTSKYRIDWINSVAGALELYRSLLERKHKQAPAVVKSVLGWNDTGTGGLREKIILQNTIKPSDIRVADDALRITLQAAQKHRPKLKDKK